MQLFHNPGTLWYAFDWDGDRWGVGMRVLTLGDRKDIARIHRVASGAEWAQVELRETLARAFVELNAKVPPDGRTWAEELERAPETLIEVVADVYREVRAATVTPPDRPEDIEAAHADLARYLGEQPALLTEESGDELFGALAPIPRYLWWAGRFYLVHFHVLTLEERRLIARFLGLPHVQADQKPLLELQHTLARAVHAVDQARVDSVIGEGLGARMDWVEDMPESLTAALAREYQEARKAPRGALYGMLADPK
ncbi:MAG: hypothetical protein KGL39_37965 [Patescibacteria group bacterium]|nr:hypothetical protein [Patescibacteria group bacterium]